METIEIIKELSILPPHNLVGNTTTKRVISPPDITDLTASQFRAMEEFIDFLTDPKQKLAILEGWAGTGKTYLISFLIEYLLTGGIPSIKNPYIAITAPTNKAVRVLARAAEYSHNNLEYRTAHSILKLKPKINAATGEIEFIEEKHLRQNVNSKPLREYDILIVDEASMLPDELFLLMEPYTHSDSLKIIFMGDGYQIPAIGAKYSISFNPEEREYYNFKVIQLTDIVRQKQGNPIIQFTGMLREKIHHPNPLIIREDNYRVGEGVVYIPNKYIAELGGLLKLYFTSENFNLNPDFCKVICYTNKYTTKFNKVIRRYIYGKQELDKVYIGEKLITGGEVQDIEGNFCFKNNEELEVLEVEVNTRVLANKDFKYYELTVVSTYEGTSPRVITMVHEDSEQQYVELLKVVAEYAGTLKGGDRLRAWEQYYELKGAFANVVYNYAITAHKAQGSNYNYSFIVIEDLYRYRRNVYERNRIGYTACSRAKDVIFMVGDL